MDTEEIESGFVRVAAGRQWLAGAGQPAAEDGEWAYFSSSSRPFLTRLDLGARMSVVAEKLLIAPKRSKVRGRLLRLVPFSFRNAIRTYELEGGWAVMATASRVRRILLAEGGTLTVAPTALVAYLGNRPTGFCPRLRLRDLFLPRVPRLRLHFHGPATVWVEGA